MPERAPSDPPLEGEPLDTLEGNGTMTQDEIKAARRKMENTVKAHHEEVELETLVSVLGSPAAQAAAESHRIPELVAKEQGRGLDFRAA